MKHFLLLATLLWLSWAQADLLDRMKLEDSFRSRIEDVIRIYDSNAKVILRFDIRGFSGVLPGTTIATVDSDVSPLQIQSSDITRMTIEIYTHLDPVPPEARELILKVIPLDDSKVAIQFKKTNPLITKPALDPLDPQSLRTIAEDAVKSLTQTLLIGLGCCLLLTLGFIYLLNTRRTKETHKQMEQLSQAIMEISNSGGPAATRDVQALPMPASNSSPTAEYSDLDDLTTESLSELFSDCYWCSKDAYAHWMWQKISGGRKQQLISELPFLREYSQYFVEMLPKEEAFHNHPYYLDPLNLRRVSQKDLTIQVQDDLSLWHRLSPLRQLTLDLSFESRVKAVQTPIRDLNPDWNLSLPISSPRILEQRSRWSELNIEDEKALLANPEIVPLHMRDKVRTLVWLCKKPAPLITEVLARFDARALAEGWVGAHEVLENLESHMPEKKLKLLKSYRQRTTPSRYSPVFQALVEEGLKDYVN